MDILTLPVHMYNIIDGIVGIKMFILFVKEGCQFESFSKALQSMVLCGGGS